MKRWCKIGWIRSSTFFLNSKKLIFDMFPSLCQWRLSLPVTPVRCGQDSQHLNSSRETAIVSWRQKRKHIINIIGKISCYIILSDIKLVNVTGMSSILATVTFQMLWLLATMNVGGLCPEYPLCNLSNVLAFGHNNI